MHIKKLFIIALVISAATISMNANAWWGGLLDDDDKYNSHDESYNQTYYKSDYNKIFSYRYVTDTQLTPQQAQIEFERKLQEEQKIQLWVDIK